MCFKAVGSYINYQIMLIMFECKLYERRICRERGIHSTVYLILIAYTLADNCIV